MKPMLALAAGSLAGGFARYFLAGVIHHRMGSHLPWGTLAVNLTACLLIGAFDAAVGRRFMVSQEGRLLLMTGFCGAYSTFSTLILEADHLLKAGNVVGAVGYVVLSALLGFLFLQAGALVGRAL